MRITARTAAAAILAGTAGAVLLGAGTASAFTTASDLNDGYVEVELEHSETVALTQSPIPDLINQVAHGYISVWRGPGGSSHGSVQGYLGEAAAHPDGNVQMWLFDPAKWDGSYVGVMQHWR